MISDRRTLNPESAATAWRGIIGMIQTLFLREDPDRRDGTVIHVAEICGKSVIVAMSRGGETYGYRVGLDGAYDLARKLLDHANHPSLSLTGAEATAIYRQAAQAVNARRA